MDKSVEIESPLPSSTVIEKLKGLISSDGFSVYPKPYSGKVTEKIINIRSYSLLFFNPYALGFDGKILSIGDKTRIKGKFKIHWFGYVFPVIFIIALIHMAYGHVEMLKTAGKEELINKRLIEYGEMVIFLFVFTLSFIFIGKRDKKKITKAIIEATDGKAI